MNEKSVASYKKLLDDKVISSRQAQVLKVLHVDLGQATNRMIAKKLELREKGLVEHAGDYYDTQTERTVNLWKCV